MLMGCLIALPFLALVAIVAAIGAPWLAAPVGLGALAAAIYGEVRIGQWRDQ